MTHSSPLPQIQAKHISLAPNLFRSIKLKRKDLPPVDGNLLLQDVSFEVSPGDRIAVVGASGAGKTTLLRLLNRLNEPTTGMFYLNGQAYAQIPPVQLRQQVMLMLQESKLLGLPVQETIAYPLHLRGMAKKEIQQRVGEWMDRLRIPTEWHDRTEQQLSVGQRQLVAIARALAAQPPILLLDEPTSALDVGRIQQVMETLMNLNQHDQTTILMVSHQLELAEQLATRVLHLEQGKLVGDEPAISVDWAALKRRLKVVEQEQAEEWE